MFAKRRNYEILPPTVLPPEEDAKIQAMIEESDREVAEVRVTLRWDKDPLGVVKQAAKAAGVPYQTYIKLAAYRQAIADLNAVSGAARIAATGSRSA